MRGLILCHICIFDKQEYHERSAADIYERNEDVYKRQLQSVAEEVNIATTYRSHLFKKEMQLTFSDYLTMIRIVAAKRMLYENRRKIHEIAIDAVSYTHLLINNARAAVLDYDKLIDMLQKKEIQGAALDVYPIEPLPHDHPLLDLDNVVLTPHIAGCSLDPYDRSYTMLLEDLDRFFKNEEPKRIYNPDSLKK